jgi:site-specific DNA recombinase
MLFGEPIGRIAWNKVRMVKDPVTRKRLSRPNPNDQYKLVEAPHLRIIDDAMFKAAQARTAPARPDELLAASAAGILAGGC